MIHIPRYWTQFGYKQVNWPVDQGWTRPAPYVPQSFAGVQLGSYCGCLMGQSITAIKQFRILHNRTLPVLSTRQPQHSQTCSEDQVDTDDRLTMRSLSEVGTVITLSCRSPDHNMHAHTVSSSDSTPGLTTVTVCWPELHTINSTGCSPYWTQQHD